MMGVERRRRGYTLVELMMALTVFAIGVTGIAAMQKVTVSANAHAKTLAIATHIAQSWEDQLAADATLWGPAATGTTGTRWLAEGEWTRPANVPSSDATFGATFDALGNFTTDPAEVFFCTHVRLTRIHAGTVELPGNGMFRTEVRVFWPRAGRRLSNPNYCAQSTDANSFTVSDTEDFHFVHMVSAVRQSTL